MAYRSFRPSGFEARGVRKVKWLALKPSVRLRLVNNTQEFSIVLIGNAPELRESPKA